MSNINAMSRSGSVGPAGSAGSERDAPGVQPLSDPVKLALNGVLAQMAQNMSARQSSGSMGKVQIKPPKDADEEEDEYEEEDPSKSPFGANAMQGMNLMQGVDLSQVMNAMQLHSLNSAQGPSGAGSWMDVARSQLGVCEGGNEGNIRAYHGAAGLNGQGGNTAWCGSYVSWVMKKFAAEKGQQVKLPSNPASAASWANFGTAANPPGKGSIVVIQNKQTGSCHVGFLEGAGPGGVRLLGGNQGNSVKVSTFPSSKWQVVAARNPPANVMASCAAPARGKAPTPQVRAWVEQAAHELGRQGIRMTERDKANMATIAMHESGGNPSAINNWDSNAKIKKADWRSKGLCQTIGPTFNSYKLAGHNDILNPVDNICSAYRYCNARYGSTDNVPGIKSLAMGGPYKGY